jgi:hypothetical protein
VAWADRLVEVFSDIRLSILPGIGHFVPVETPDMDVAAIVAVTGTP